MDKKPLSELTPWNLCSTN